MTKTITPEALAATIVVGVFVLLIGLRFDARWAGGEGYKRQAIFLAVETVTPSGEPANTGIIEANRANVLQTTSFMRQFKTYGYSYPCSIWLDRDTTVTIGNAKEGETTFALESGRILVDCEASVTAREASITFAGVATFVNYGWLHQLDARLIEGGGEIHHGDETLPFLASIAVSMDTIDALAPIKEGGAFALDAPTVTAFYAWVLTDE